jgi:hypothetical protein
VLSFERRLLPPPLGRAGAPDQCRTTRPLRLLDRRAGQGCSTWLPRMRVPGCVAGASLILLRDHHLRVRAGQSREGIPVRSRDQVQSSWHPSGDGEPIARGSQHMQAVGHRRGEHGKNCAELQRLAHRKLGVLSTWLARAPCVASGARHTKGHVVAAARSATPCCRAIEVVGGAGAHRYAATDEEVIDRRLHRSRYNTMRTVKAFAATRLGRHPWRVWGPWITDAWYTGEHIVAQGAARWPGEVPSLDLASQYAARQCALRPEVSGEVGSSA